MARRTAFAFAASAAFLFATVASALPEKAGPQASENRES
jgi:hypothetical protein